MHGLITVPAVRFTIPLKYRLIILAVLIVVYVILKLIQKKVHEKCEKKN